MSLLTVQNLQGEWVVYGGQQPENPLNLASELVHSDVCIFNFSQLCWSRPFVAALLVCERPEGRFGAASTCLDGSLVVLGGACLPLHCLLFPLHQMALLKSALSSAEAVKSRSPLLLLPGVEQ